MKVTEISVPRTFNLEVSEDEASFLMALTGAVRTRDLEEAGLESLWQALNTGRVPAKFKVISETTKVSRL